MPTESSSTRHVHIIGWGAALPERKLTNQQIANSGIDTSTEKIKELTGIEERRVANPGSKKETTVELGTQAALHALEIAKISPDKIGLIICATSSPDFIFPATASLIQDNIGANRAGAYDLSAACTGFVYGLVMAASYIKAGEADFAVVVASETISRFVDWTDRSTCILFGDGAGAVVLGVSSAPGGILASELGSDGSGGDLLTLPAGGSQVALSQQEQHIKMNGRAVFKFGTRKPVELTKSVLKKAGLTIKDISLLILHQANERILTAVEAELGIPTVMVPRTIDHYGNTSAASIPLTLTEAIADGKVRVGDKVVFVGFGAGLSWGGCVVEWGTPTQQQPPDAWQKAARAVQRRSARIQSWGKRQKHHSGL